MTSTKNLTLTTIEMPGGRIERCSKPGNCRRHNVGTILGPTAPAASFDAFLAEQPPVKPDEVPLSQGFPPLAERAGKRTYADLLRSADKGQRVVVWGGDGRVPAGHFIASTKMMGIVTEYLLAGTQGDENARIVGRIELGDPFPGSRGARNASIAYRGSELKGGEFLGTVQDFDKSFERMALNKGIRPEAPATVDPRGNSFEITAYARPEKTRVKAVNTQHQFAQAVNQPNPLPGGVVRLVEADLSGKHWSPDINATPEIHAPSDGTPLLISFKRGYTRLVVASGNVVINATDPHGGGIDVRPGASLTVITPGSKFSVRADEGSTVKVFPRAGARGRVWASSPADTQVEVDDTYEHTFEAHYRDLS
jgi:hypothetical protein